MKLRRWTRELRDFLLPLHGGASAAEQRSRLTVNEQLLREQDREHTRELWRISLLGVAVLVPLLLYVWLQVSFMETAYKLEALQSEQSQLERLLRRAQLERASLETPARIEELARQRLAMLQPPPESVRSVQLVDSGKESTDTQSESSP
jgi:cell division protein FtsL